MPIRLVVDVFWNSDVALRPCAIGHRAITVTRSDRTTKHDSVPKFVLFGKEKQSLQVTKITTEKNCSRTRHSKCYSCSRS